MSSGLIWAAQQPSGHNPFLYNNEVDSSKDSLAKREYTLIRDKIKLCLKNVEHMDSLRDKIVNTEDTLKDLNRELNEFIEVYGDTSSVDIENLKKSEDLCLGLGFYVLESEFKKGIPKVTKTLNSLTELFDSNKLGE